MLTRRTFALSALLIPALTVTAPSSPARAQGQGSATSIEILVLFARKDPKGGAVDPRVPKIPQLSQAPFSDYNSYAFLDDKTLKLDAPKGADPWKGKPSATYALATGKPLTVALLEQGTDKRFQMGGAIGKETPDVVRWTAPAGEPFFIAGQRYKDGILVIGITIRG
jgi:hypothetical protein